MKLEIVLSQRRRKVAKQKGTFSQQFTPFATRKMVLTRERSHEGKEMRI
jgi:hypothetical protein